MAKGKMRASPRYGDAHPDPDPTADVNTTDASTADVSTAHAGPAASYVTTVTLQDLEYIEETPCCYSLGELGSRLLCMAYLRQGNPEATIDLCTSCMQLAMGEKPCPHGTFPEDTRERPLLLWREDLFALVTELVRELMASSAPPTVPSAGEDERRSSQTRHRRFDDPAPQVPRGHIPLSPSISSVSSITSSSASTVSAARSSVSELGATLEHAHIQGTTNPGEGSSHGVAHDDSHYQGCMYLLDELRNAVVTALSLDTRSASRPMPPSGTAQPTAPSTAPATPERAARAVPTPATPERVARAAPAPAASAPAAPALATPAPAAPAAGPSVTPVPPPVPAAPYNARIDPFSATVSTWYMVTVGRTVGVLNNWPDMHHSINHVKNNFYCKFKSYQEAVQCFHLTESHGEVTEAGQ